MSWRNFPRDLLRRTTPARGVIKWRAHAATLAAAALMVPSLCAIYFWQAGLKENEEYWVWAARMVWTVHAGVVGLALIFWVFEKPRATEYMRDDAVGRVKFARAHPQTMLMAAGAVALLIGWLAYLRIELAWESWRWGWKARAIGQGVGGLVLVLGAVVAGAGPAIAVAAWGRKWIRGERGK